MMSVIVVCPTAWWSLPMLFDFYADHHPDNRETSHSTMRVRVYNVQQFKSRLVNQWQCTTSSLEGREPQLKYVGKHTNTKVQEYKNTWSMSCNTLLTGGSWTNTEYKYNTKIQKWKILGHSVKTEYLYTWGTYTAVKKKKKKKETKMWKGRYKNTNIWSISGNALAHGRGVDGS